MCTSVRHVETVGSVSGILCSSLGEVETEHHISMWAPMVIAEEEANVCNLRKIPCTHMSLCQSCCNANEMLKYPMPRCTKQNQRKTNSGAYTLL